MLAFGLTSSVESVTEPTKLTHVDSDPVGFFLQALECWYSVGWMTLHFELDKFLLKFRERTNLYNILQTFEVCLFEFAETINI